MTKDSLDRFIQSASYEPDRYYIPCSLVSVNSAIDCKLGFRSGRILEIVGLYSTGKTTLALDLIKNTQALGMKALFVDVERTFDNTYAKTCGVSIDDLDIVRADTAENTLTIIERHAPNYNIIVLDSLPALVPKDEFDKDYDDSPKMAAVGTLLTRFYKRIVPIVDTENILLVTLNQYRANFSTLSKSDKKPYGANSSHHAITWRLELARVKNEENTATVQAKVTKNKLGRERGMAEYNIIYGKGLDVIGDILTHAVRQGIVTQKGAWYYYNDLKAQGLDRAKELFNFDTLKEQINGME